MSFLNLEQLPFVGISYEFLGEKQGAPFSAYIVNAKPGQGPPLHTHPYVEVAFVIEGTATFTLGDEYAGQGRRRMDRKAIRGEAVSDRVITSQTREVKSGGIVVIPADTPYRFVNPGNTALRQIDIHASPRFIQTNLT
jgi:mannose-6-phosphate isomerase-like protein (cupin superfamily)